MQGPYVYALYQHYGFAVGDIGRLFIAGFGASMVVGTIAGSMADQQCAAAPQAAPRCSRLCARRCGLGLGHSPRVECPCEASPHHSGAALRRCIGP